MKIPIKIKKITFIKLIDFQIELINYLDNI